MRDFLSVFTDSAKEFTKVRSLVTTSLLVAVSMVIEMFSIDIGFAKLNFAFLAIAIIGMLFGPCMGMMAGFACDIVGYLAHPSGGFLPAYVLVGGLQGLFYGLFLYQKWSGHSIQFVSNKPAKFWKNIQTQFGINHKAILLKGDGIHNNTSAYQCAYDNGRTFYLVWTYHGNGGRPLKFRSDTYLKNELNPVLDEVIGRLKTDPPFTK